MKTNYETFVSNGKLVFKITEGDFEGVTYIYDSLNLDGKIQYKLRAKKNAIDDNNRILFENTITHILRDKLSKL